MVSARNSAQFCAQFSHAAGVLHRRRKYDDEVSPRLLRVSVGLEEVEHLKADLERGILAVS